MKILVTGGASGLGEAITRRLAANSSNEVWFSYCRSEPQAQQLTQAYPNARAIRCDFTVSAEIGQLIQKMDEMDLDALVNNAIAAPIAKTHFHKTSLDLFRRGFDHNLLPTIAITQKAISHFRFKKGGRIITVLTASLAGKPPTGYAEYTAAKAYLHSLAKSWASENAAFGITSNCVSPGYMSTRLTSDTDERVVEAMINQNPLKRLLTPAEVAEAVEFYLQATSQINGTNLLINAASEMV